MVDGLKYGWYMDWYMGWYPLVMCYIAIENGPFIVSFPSKNWEFVDITPWLCQKKLFDGGKKQHIWEDNGNPWGYMGHTLW